MKNKAKCKLCGDIIESVTIADYIECSCAEIAISGGDQRLECYAKDFSNFVRVDEEGEEVAVTVIEKKVEKADITREEKINLVSSMIDYFEHLPPEAMLSTPTQYDLKAIYLLLKTLI